MVWVVRLVLASRRPTQALEQVYAPLRPGSHKGCSAFLVPLCLPFFHLMVSPAILSLILVIAFFAFSLSLNTRCSYHLLHCVL